MNHICHAHHWRAVQKMNRTHPLKSPHNVISVTDARVTIVTTVISVIFVIFIFSGKPASNAIHRDVAIVGGSRAIRMLRVD